MKRLALICALVTAQPAYPQDLPQPVRLGTDGAYPPYSFLNPDEGLDGFEVELASILCAEIAADCTWVRMPWEDLISALDTGKIDAIMSGMGPNPERAQIIAFSEPYHGSGSAAWLVRRGDTLVPGARVAVLKGSLQEGHAMAEGFDVIGTATIEAAVEAVAEGTADAAIGMTQLMEGFAAASDGSLEVTSARITFDGGVRIGFRPGETALLDAFNAGLAAIERGGKLREVTDKWFPPASNN